MVRKLRNYGRNGLGVFQKAGFEITAVRNRPPGDQRIRYFGRLAGSSLWMILLSLGQDGINPKRPGTDHYPKTAADKAIRAFLLLKGLSAAR
jgi:hypothetical protein